MARIVLTVVLIVLISVLVGCSGADEGKGQLIPSPVKKFGYTGEVKVTQAEELDTVEQVTVNRQAYRQSLKKLVEYYNKAGNNMKFQWVEKELAALNAMPQYKYIIEAEVAGPSLQATTSIPEADALYKEATKLDKRGNQLILIKDNDLLRLALDKYNELINKYPSSDKIDDAAYRSGNIYEYFKDYSIAILYFKRTYQWNPETSSPARFKAAYLLDQVLHQRAEALEIYQEAVKSITKQGEHEQWRLWAEQRIRELSASN